MAKKRRHRQVGSVDGAAFRETEARTVERNGAARLRRRAPVAVGLLGGGLALALYLITLAPTVTFADAGELATAVYHLDVAYPPGFPLYLLLGKAYTLLVPWGRFIQRLNAFSALCAAAAVGMTGAALVVGLGVGRAQPTGRPKKGEGERILLPAWASTLLALAAAGLLAVSRTFWEQATLTEVYTLNMAVAAGLLLLWTLYAQARQEADERRADRLMAGAALLSGLGMGNHLTLLFVALGVFLGAWLEEGIAFWSWQRLLPRAGLFVLGLAVYLYLPLRALAAPPMNWGDPSRTTRFWRHVSGRQYQVNFAPRPATWAAQISFFLPRLWGEFSPVPLLLAPAGLYRLFRQRRSLAWGGVLSAGLVLFYALSYDIAEDQETYYLLLFLLLAVWIGQGMAQVAEWLRKEARRMGRLLVPPLTLLFLLLVLWPLLAHGHLCDRRSYTYAEEYARDVLENLPAEAVVLTRDWNLFAPAYYLQQVEAVRPDVVLVDQELLRRTWYLDTVARRFPWLAREAAEPLEAYRVELVKFEQGQPYEFATIQGRFQELGDALLGASIKAGRPALMTPEVEYGYLVGAGIETVGGRYRSKVTGGPPVGGAGVGEAYIWVPQALAFRLVERAVATFPAESFAQSALREPRPHDELTRKVVNKYAQHWLYRGLYLQVAGDCPGAVSAYEAALVIQPSLTEALQGIRSCR